MKYMIVALAVLALMVSPLAAESFNGPFFGPKLDTIGLLNPNNLQMNHSVSFMSGFSSTGEGFYQSTYTNHLLYSFNPKLDLKVDLNFINYGTADWSRDLSINSNNDNANAVIPEFSLQYRPSDNTRIIIEYRQAVHPHSTKNWRW